MYQYFKGTFNYHREVWVGNTKAHTEKQAFTQLTKAFSLHKGISTSLVRNYFLSVGNSWEIKSNGLVGRHEAMVPDNNRGNTTRDVSIY